MNVKAIDEVGQVAGPYPGLRPFLEFESAFFYGRDEQVGEVIDRLRRTQFVVVLGGSGSGKSSLILAGAIPQLRSYALSDAGDFWIPIVATPGTNHAKGSTPLSRVARKFCAALKPLEEPQATQRIDECNLLLRRPHGFGEIVDRYAPELADTAGLDPRHANLLLLIDQFEELFHPSNRELAECDALVDRVLDNFRHPHPRLFVVLTMRSEHLSDCAKYLDLPDAINKASYLIRRLDPEQIGQAIDRPAIRYLRLMARRVRQRHRGHRDDAAVAEHASSIPDSSEFDAQVRERLSRDAEELRGNPDHLPLLQHLLFRVWAAAGSRAAGAGLAMPDRIATGDLCRAVCASDEIAEHPSIPEDANCLELSLENWAQRLYREQQDQHSKLESVFRSLAFKEPNTGTYTQQRAGFEELVAQLGLANETELLALLQPWISPHGYLFWDTESRTVKVAHESFIRGWSAFRRWIDEEDDRFQEYVRLLGECQNWDSGGRKTKELIERARLKRLRDVGLEEALRDQRLERRLTRLLDIHRDGGKLNTAASSVAEYVRLSIAEQARLEDAEAKRQQEERRREEQEREAKHELEKAALRQRTTYALVGVIALGVVVLALVYWAERQFWKKERLMHRAYALAAETQLAYDTRLKRLGASQLPLRNVSVGTWHFDSGGVQLGPITELVTSLMLPAERRDGVERTTILAEMRNTVALQTVLGFAIWPVKEPESETRPIESPVPVLCDLIETLESGSAARRSAAKSSPTFLGRTSDPEIGLLLEGGDFEPLQISTGSMRGNKCQRGSQVLSLPAYLSQGTRVAFDADLGQVFVRLSASNAPKGGGSDYLQRYEIAWPESRGLTATARPRGLNFDPDFARSIGEQEQRFIRLPTVPRPSENATDLKLGNQWVRVFGLSARHLPGIDRASWLPLKPAKGLCAHLEKELRGKVDPEQDLQLDRMLEDSQGDRSVCVVVQRNARWTPAAASAEKYFVSVYRLAPDMPVANKRVPLLAGIEFGSADFGEMFLGAGDFEGWVRADLKAAPWSLTAWKRLAMTVRCPNAAQSQSDVERYAPAFDLVRGTAEPLSEQHPPSEGALGSSQHAVCR